MEKELHNITNEVCEVIQKMFVVNNKKVQLGIQEFVNGIWIPIRPLQTLSLFFQIEDPTSVSIYLTDTTIDLYAITQSYTSLIFKGRLPMLDSGKVDISFVEKLLKATITK